MTTAIDFEIRINPEYKSLLPPMAKEAFDSLVSSIQDDGQYEPITINDKGEILDGHHRFSACKFLEIELKYDTKTFDNSLYEKLYVIDVNLQRRQLTDPQRVQLCLKKKPVLEELAKLNQSLAGKSYGKGIDSSVQICTELSPIGRVNEVIAKSSGVSARQVSKIEEVLKKAEDGLKNRVLAGTTSVDKALKKIKKQERHDELIQEALNNPMIENLSTGTQLFHGSFIEKSKDISDNSVDLIFTDPPYEKESIFLYGELAKVAQRVLKPGGSLIVYAGGYLLLESADQIRNNSSSLKWNWQLIMLHGGSKQTVHRPKVFVGYKPLLWFVKGDKSNAPEYILDVLHSKQPDKIAHDWEQSPLEAEQCISRLTVENQIVFDPMMGYATTGVAAMRLKRKFIGMEIDKEHFRTAQLRMKKIALNSKVI